MATFYDYENRTALDPYTGAGAPNAVGQVFAKTDTTFSTPLTVVLMGSGLQATDMTTDQYSQLPGFQVDGHLQVVFKSGDFTKVLNTTTPLVGPQGAAVSEAVDNGDNTVTFLLEDGTPAATVALPASDVPGPPGEKGDKGDTGLPGPDAIPADEAVATYATTPGTATATALSATTAAEVSKESARRRRDIRAKAPAPMPASRLVAFPTTGGLAGAGFTWTAAPIKVYSFGNDYVTNFEPEGVYPVALGKTIYVDTVNGLSTNDGLTEATAAQSINKALTLAVDGDQIVLLDKDVIHRAGGFSGARVTKSVRIRAKTPGVIVACADNLAYTKTAGASYVYQSARTNVIDVVDMGVFWAPDGYKLPKVADLATCDATPGSWWHDGTNVFVHTVNGKAPDSKRVFATLAADNLWVESGATDVHVFTEGIRFLGGSDGLVVNAANAKASFYARDCSFIQASGVNASRANACNFMGTQYVYLRNCRAVGSKKDGFNYAAYNNAGTLKDAPKVIEVDCESYDHGLAGANGDTCNASTGHSGSKIIRVNVKGHHTQGAIFAEVQDGTQSLNYGCVAYDSTSTTTGSSSAFHAQQAGADMWVYGGEGFGADWTIYANSGTWLGYKGMTPETKQGGGTIVAMT